MKNDITRTNDSQSGKNGGVERDLHPEKKSCDNTGGVGDPENISINAPHQRQRLFWVADRGEGQERIAEYSQDSGMGNTEGERPERLGRESGKPQGQIGRYGNGESDSGLGDTTSNKEHARAEIGLYPESSDECDSGIEWLYCRDNKYRPIKSSLKPLVDGVARGVVYRGGAIDPNDTGLARAIRLKGYGNAINADVAREFIRAFMDVRG